MEEKNEEKRTSKSERVVKKPVPKSKPPKRVVKKEYTVVLVKPTVLIVSLDGITNTRIAKTKSHKDLKVGDKMKM